MNWHSSPNKKSADPTVVGIGTELLTFFSFCVLPSRFYNFPYWLPAPDSPSTDQGP